MADWRKIRPVRAREWLDFLPEEVYDVSDSSHIVRLMDALCGDSGVGYLRKRGILQRLQTSLHETRFGDLDELYSVALGLPRLPSEQYAVPSDGLVTWGQEERMNLCDARYRARISSYLSAWQYGATKRGVELAAKAACGKECQVIDLTQYDRSRGLSEHAGTDTRFVGTYWDADDTPTYVPMPVGNGGRSGYVIVVMNDGDLSQEETKSICDVVSRIHPQHVDLYVTNRRCVLETLGQSESSQEVVPCSVVSASSEWWNVVRTVTGRRDWDYDAHPTSWVRPDVAVEAPRQALVYCQEDKTDMTHLVRSASASSEHVGPYNSDEASRFPYLRGVGKGVSMGAWKSISATRSKWYSVGYVSDESMLDWAYSTDLTGEMESKEDARYQRMWSSVDSLDGGEWLCLSLSSQTPINRIALNLCRKPVSVEVWCSQSVSAEWGDDTWFRATDDSGNPVGFSIRQWGGASVAGEMVSVSMPFSTTVVGSVCLVFDRLDVPCVNENGDGSYSVSEFPYSVDVASTSLWLDVLDRGQFPSDGYSYRDVYGNLVSSSIRVRSAEMAVSPVDGEYWVSQPNIGEDAVEWIVFDVRSGGSPSRISYVDITAVYSGAHMVAYSSDDGENWVPYPGDFVLSTGRFELEARTTSYIKLEFSLLTAIPYEVISDGIAVGTRRYPYFVRNRAITVASTTRSLDRAARLLTTPEESSAWWDDAYPQPMPSEELTRNFTSGGESLFWAGSYRSTNDVSVSSSLGYQNTAVEGAPVEPYALPMQSSRSFPRFETGEPHDYDERPYERSLSIAYVVGISGVSFGRDAVSVVLDGLTPFDIELSGGANQASSDWVIGEHEMRPREGDVVSRLETVDMQSSSMFRSFDLSVSQRAARQAFESPSDMGLEWHGANGSVVETVGFGLNGTTLSLVSGSGIESDGVMLPAYSIAKASVQLFAEGEGRWALEAVDASGENVFTMEYDVPSRKWTTIGATFPVGPGNMWWDSSYAYRFRLDIDGPVEAGQAIFVPNVSLASLSALYGASGEWDERNPEPTDLSTVPDVRVVYYDGISYRELPWDVTGDQEMWIQAQQSVPYGHSADGSRHTDIGMFVGAYYVYLYHASIDGGTGQHTVRDVSGLEPPSHDWTGLFSGNDVTDDSHVSYDADAASFYNGASVRIDDAFFPSLSDDQGGFFDVRIGGMGAFVTETDEAGVEHVRDGDRYVFECDDDVSGRSASLYFHDGQMTFKIVEPDGYVNSWVERYSESMVRDRVVGSALIRLVVRWGARGTEPVYRADAEDISGDSQVDANDKRRRRIDVWLASSDGGLEHINNVYDERHYDDGVY